MLNSVLKIERAMSGTAQSLFVFSSEATSIFCFQCENSKFFTLLARSSNYVDEPLVSILYAHGDFSWVHLHQNISYICYGLLLPVDNATIENM